MSQRSPGIGRAVALRRAASVLSILVLGKLVCGAEVLPAPTGPLAVGRSEYFWTDAARPEEATDDATDKRTIRVDLWYPAEKTPDSKPARYFHDVDKLKARLGIERLVLNVVRTHTLEDPELPSTAPRYPVVVFSPGAGNNGTDYTALAEELASHGYGVATVDHPYAARGIAFPDGRLALPAPWKELTDPAARLEDYRRRVVERAADMSFALDKLTDLNAAEGKFHGRFDLARVGAAGHSIGGVAAPEACRSDARFRAAVNLDGHAASLPCLLDADGKGPRQALLELTDVPTPPSDEKLAEWKMTRAEFDRAAAEAQQRADKVMRSIAGSARVTIAGATHNSFGDSFLWTPGKYDERHRLVQIVRDYVRAFFDQTLRAKKDTALDAAKPPFEEVTVERFDR